MNWFRPEMKVASCIGTAVAPKWNLLKSVLATLHYVFCPLPGESSVWLHGCIQQKYSFSIVNGEKGRYRAHNLKRSFFEEGGRGGFHKCNFHTVLNKLLPCTPIINNQYWLYLPPTQKCFWASKQKKELWWTQYQRAIAGISYKSSKQQSLEWYHIPFQWNSPTIYNSLTIYF